MKKTMYLLGTLAVLGIVTLTSCKKEDPKPIAGVITKIVFYDWIDPDEADDSGPDVYFTIEDANGNTIYNLGSDNRIPDVEDIFYWSNLNIELNLTTKFYVRLWDYDPLDYDDDMGACGGITLNTYANMENPPEYIDISCDNMDYRIYVTWKY